MADKALIKNGKIIVVDRGGVKTILTVTGGVKSIEVTLTENAASIDIDLTPLNLVEGSVFNILLSLSFINPSTEVAVDGREMIIFNNITTTSYVWAASIWEYIYTMSPVCATKEVIIECKIINNKLRYSMKNNYITASGTRSTNDSYFGYIDVSIINITSIKISCIAILSYIFKVGDIIKITKIC